MKHNAIRKLAVAVGTVAIGTPAADAASSAAVSASVVPPPGSGTSYGYTAFVRHPSSWNDGQGMLVLQAPDGQHTTIGQVSDGPSTRRSSRCCQASEIGSSKRIRMHGPRSIANALRCAAIRRRRVGDGQGRDEGGCVTRLAIRAS